MNIKTLNEIAVGNMALVKKVNSTGDIRRRLLDIGLTPGTKIESVLKSSYGGLVAYKIREAMIAIRDEDAKNIMVEEAIYE